VEYYSALIKMEILPHDTTQMNLEDIAKQNKPITKGQTWYDSTLMRVPKLSKSQKQSRKLFIKGGGGE
jgi:hypothetical protein